MSTQGQVPDGYVLVPKAAIRWLRAERDEAIAAARTALQSSPQPTAGGDAPTDRQTIKAPLPASFGEDTPEKREKLQRFAEAVSWPDGFSPDWTLSASEQIQVALTLALTKHVPGWPGATDEQLEAVAGEVLKVDALSAERARVIEEASTWILGLEDAIRECINFIESDMAEMAVYETERVLEDPTILERRPSFLPPVRPALRSLAQQDSGGADAST